MENELKACPFCGNKAELCSDGDETMFYVACSGPNCYCCFGEAYDNSAMPEHCFHEREAAIAAWNTRTDAAEVQRLRDALEAAMRCETCEGSGRLFYPPSCNCYGDPVCTHPEIEGECVACEGSGKRDVPGVTEALA